MVFKRVLNWLINFTIVFLIITFSPGLGPKTTFPFEEFSVSRPRSIEPNNYLENPEILLKGKILGPEHILEKDGIFYASSTDGTVVKIVGEEVEVLSQFGKYCTKNEKIPMCGRPLGLAWDPSKNDTIIVMDSSLGVLELNVKTKKLKRVIFNNEEVGRENPREQKLVNSAAVAKNGDIYYTSSTSDVELNQIFLSFFLNPSGRLIKFDRKTKKTTVLLDRLFFANGVALSPNEDFVVVSDLGRNRLIKYYISGKQADYHTIFVDNLPGVPDNLTPDEKGLWVAIPIASEPDNMLFFQKLSQYPTIRKFFARALYLTGALLNKIYSYVPNEAIKSAALTIDSFGSYKFLYPQRSSIIRLNWNGEVIESYHSFDGSSYTHVLDTNDGKLYLGSFFQDYIARVDRRNHD
ncbi:hypothetical protein ACKWTF_002833 [Chironomus riparius]